MNIDAQKNDLLNEIEILDKAWIVAKKPKGRLSFEALTERLSGRPLIKVLGPFFMAIISALAAFFIHVYAKNNMWVILATISTFMLIMGISSAASYMEEAKELADFRRQEKEYLEKRAELQARYDAL
jgi:hypothetical protein